VSGKPMGEHTDPGAEPSGANWFAGLPSRVQSEFESCMVQRQRRYAPGEPIYLEGDHANAMYRIASGRVRMRSVSPRGKEFLMVIFGPGWCIGTVALLDGLPRHTDAVAECASVLDVVYATDFHRIAQVYPEVYKAVAASYAVCMRHIQSMFVGGYSLEERLARRLDLLLDFGATREIGSGALRLDFTQEMLASSVAVSRQAISKLLQEWHDRGVINYEYGSLWVLDRQQLRRLAGKLIDDYEHNARPTKAELYAPPDPTCASR
jgi:CRP/FNR family transcriptional regulator, cyclic AMP receptor protein